jgi:hypothetical protein
VENNKFVEVDEAAIALAIYQQVGRSVFVSLKKLMNITTGLLSPITFCN